MTRKEIGEAVAAKMAEKNIKANHFRKIGLNEYHSKIRQDFVMLEVED